MSYSENQITDLAHNDPKELVRILSSPDVEARVLTYGVEILGGEILDEDMVVPVFRKLLRHMNALVREGTMMGIAAFYDRKIVPRELVDRLKIISLNDPSPINKETAKSLIADLESA